MSPATTSTTLAPPKSLLRDMVQGTGLYSVALIGQRIAGMILLPVYTRYLSPADYGVLELLEQSVGFLAILFGSNFSSALFYFYFLHPEREWRNKAAATNIIGAGIAGILTAAVGIAFAPQLSALVFRTPDMAHFFRILFAATAISFILEALFCWLRAENKPQWFAGISLVRLLMVIVLSCTLLVVFKLTVLGVLISNLVGSLVLTTAVAIYCVRVIGVSFDLKLFWRMLRFSLPLALSGVALFVMHFADRFILQRFVSLSQVGVYALAYKIGMMISFIHASFHTYWSSQVYQILRRPDAEGLFARVFTYMMTVLSLSALGLIVLTKPAVTLLATKQFEGAVLVVPLIVGAYYMRALGDFFRLLFAVQKRTGVDAACNWIGAAVCLVSYFILIPPYGMWGAAAATALTFTVVAGVAYYWASRMMVFHLEMGRLLKVTAITALLAAIYFAFPIRSLLGQIVFAIVILIQFPALLLITGFLTGPEKLRVQLILRAARERLLPSRVPI